MAQQRANAQAIQHANQNIINIKAEYRREKAKAEEKIGLKKTNEMNAFNMLQDLRHLIIVDLRETHEFEGNTIRKAVNCSLADYKQMISAKMIELANSLKIGGDRHDRKAGSHFDNDDFRRVLFVVSEIK